MTTASLLLWACIGSISATVTSPPQDAVVSQLIQRVETLEASNQALTSFYASMHASLIGLQTTNSAAQIEMRRLQEENNKMRQELDSVRQNYTAITTDIASKLNASEPSVSFHVGLKYQSYGNDAILKPGNVVTNQGNFYDVTSGVFRAPLNGTYLFLATIATSSYSPHKMDDAIHLIVDGYDVTRCMTSYPGYVVQGSCHVVLKLRHGQRVWLKNMYTGSVYFSDVSTFTGVLLQRERL